MVAVGEWLDGSPASTCNRRGLTDFTWEQPMLTYRDFRPQPLEKNFFGAVSKYEPMPELMARINAWIKSESIQPLSVETLLVPALVDELRSEIHLDPSLVLHLQTVRVWSLND